MQYALINGMRRTAEPKLNAICGHCNSEVRAKCGSKMVWHWAHIASENCDSWYEPETQWHRDWKNQFGKDHSEISIIKDGVRHIADVCTKNNLVIEFQNSAISAETIVERELFYDKMIWVLNGAHFKENVAIWDKEFYDEWMIKPELIKDLYLSYSQPRARVLIFHGNQIKHEEIRTVLSELKFIHNKKSDLYCYDLKNLHNESVLIDIIHHKAYELYLTNSKQKELKPVVYTWNRARKSWQDSKKPVFIDFGEDYLIWIKTNAGNKNGEGRKFSKKYFLEKYKTE